MWLSKRESLRSLGSNGPTTLSPAAFAKASTPASPRLFKERASFSSLANAPPGMQKQMLGEKLFPLVAKLQPELAVPHDKLPVRRVLRVPLDQVAHLRRTPIFGRGDRRW